MPFKIKKTSEGWILNANGDVLVEDTDANLTLWIPNNCITFNEYNEPVFQDQLVGDNSMEYQLDIVDDTNNDESSNTNAETPTEVDEQDTISSDSRTIWSHDETLALITAVESRYDDMHHVRKRKSFWTVIVQDLLSQNINYAEHTCKKKWLNLVRTYKTTKDNKSKTGRGPTRFLFFERLDDILGDSPSNSSPHSIDSGNSSTYQTKDSPLAATLEASCTSSSKSTEVSRKRKNPTMEYVALKKRYYAKKEAELSKRTELHTKFMKDTWRLRNMKIDLLKQKLEIEERKVAALEKLAEQQKDKQNIF